MRSTVTAPDHYVIQGACADQTTVIEAPNPPTGPEVRVATLEGPLEHDDRDLTRRLLLVFGETRHQFLLPGPDRLAFLPIGDVRPNVNGLRPDLDRDGGVRDEVMEPIRVGVCATLGRKDRPSALTESLAGQRIDSLDTGPGATVMKKQQGMALERPAHAALIGPELFDDLVVPVSHGYNNAASVAHIPPSFLLNLAVARSPSARSGNQL
jgi:hypothetical protein